MHYSRFFLLMFCVGCALCATRVLGIDPPSELASDTETRQTLNEIEKIRNQLGGGVLQGTSLHAAENDNVFGESVRTILESKHAEQGTKPALPAAWNVEQSPLSRTQPKGSEAARTDSPALNSRVRDRSPKQVVELMRARSSQLDVIANHIETLREYDKADQLRNIATDLRMLARQFDVPKSGVEILPDR